MTNKTKIYNTGKVATRNELNELIKAAEDSGDWSKVEQANVSKIKDMFNLFYSINGIKCLNLDGWDTSNVVDMSSMFSSSDYNRPLNFDTSSVTDMRYMFYNSVYNYPLDFNTSNVTNMRYMFCNSKYNYPLNFDTANVANMSYMFANLKYNRPLLFDTRNVENMEGIFDNASITHPITFIGGTTPDDVQDFIDETNTVYEEKCKLEGAVHHKDDNNIVITSSFKL